MPARVVNGVTLNWASRDWGTLRLTNNQVAMPTMTTDMGTASHRRRRRRRGACARPRSSTRGPPSFHQASSSAVYAKMAGFFWCGCLWTGRASVRSQRLAVRSLHFRCAAISFQECRQSLAGVSGDRLRGRGSSSRIGATHWRGFLDAHCSTGSEPGQIGAGRAGSGRITRPDAVTAV